MYLKSPYPTKGMTSPFRLEIIILMRRKGNMISLDWSQPDPLAVCLIDTDHADRHVRFSERDVTLGFDWPAIIYQLPNLGFVRAFMDPGHHFRGYRLTSSKYQVASRYFLSFGTIEKFIVYTMHACGFVTSTRKCAPTFQHYDSPRALDT